MVLEFTVNDNDTVALNSPQRLAYEHLVRRLLARPGGRRPAVVLLHLYAWWRAASAQKGEGLYYKEPEQQLTLLSHVRGRAGARAGASAGPHVAGMLSWQGCAPPFPTCLLPLPRPLPRQYYDVPSLSLRSAAWRLWQAGVDGFKARSLHAMPPA